MKNQIKALGTGPESFIARFEGGETGFVEYLRVKDVCPKSFGRMPTGKHLKFAVLHRAKMVAIRIGGPVTITMTPFVMPTGEDGWNVKFTP
jgi:hypothetical protein